MEARLVDTGPICYYGPDGLTWRPCRTWQLPFDAGHMSIVTEIGEGKSITNAAEDIVRSLTAAYPDTTVIEHWPACTGVPAEEHYDEVELDGDGELHWQRFKTELLKELLPGLDETRPIGPAVNGEWISAENPFPYMVEPSFWQAVTTVETVDAAPACPDCGGTDLRPYETRLAPPKGQKKPIIQPGTICWQCRLFRPTVDKAES